MSQAILESVQQDQLKTNIPPYAVGDTVDVHVRIIEGAKERVQVFTGVIIAESGKGMERTITVRRIVANEGVERVFPIHSPRIDKIEVKRHGHVRRSKLYYLRDRVGKKRRLRDRRRGLDRLVRDEQAFDKNQQEAAAAEADAKAADGAEESTDE